MFFKGLLYLIYKEKVLPNMKEWLDEEIDLLKKEYSKTPNDELSQKLNKSLNQINYCAKKYNLLKSRDYIKCMMIDRNKEMGRDLTDDLLKEIALKYKTRSQFQYEDSSAYVTSRKKGILDDICSHMIPQSYSTPQLILKYITEKLFNRECIYNNRRVIPPYEIDIYFPHMKLGFEYNGKGWHIDNGNDIKKNKMCKNKGIELITIIENNRKYEIDIKEQLSEYFDGVWDIEVDYNEVYDNILDDEKIINIVNKYTKYSDFINNEKNLYWKLKNLKLIEKYTSYLTKSFIKWDIHKMKQEITKYEYLTDFINNSHACYIYIKKHKEYNYLLKSLKYNIKTFYTEDELWEIVKKYNSYHELYLKDRKVITKLTEFGKNEDIRKYYRSIWGDESIRNVVTITDNYIEFRKTDAYHNCDKKTLIDIKKYYKDKHRYNI